MVCLGWGLLWVDVIGVEAGMFTCLTQAETVMVIEINSNQSRNGIIILEIPYLLLIFNADILLRISTVLPTHSG